MSFLAFYCGLVPLNSNKPTRTESFTRLLTVAIILATGLKVAAVLVGGPSPISGDALGYWQLSSSVMDGDMLMMDHPIAYRTPVYPWFLALIRTASPWPLPTLVVLQGLLFFATVWITSTLAVEITERRGARWLTLALGLPMVSAITFAATALTETLFVFLLMVHLLAVFRYQRSPSSLRSGWAAITFAVLLLTRPIAIAMWIASVAFLLVAQTTAEVPPKSDRRSGLKRLLPSRQLVFHGIVAVFTVAVVISPWLYRNGQLFGKPMLTEFVGRNIWIVTFQDGSGADLSLPSTPNTAELKKRLAHSSPWQQWQDDENWRATWAVSNALVDSGLDDAQADRLMRGVALAAAGESPNTFTEKSARRIVNFWRTAATELPEQGFETGDVDELTSWHWRPSPINAVLENRFSLSVRGNTWLMFVSIAATLLLLCFRRTRAVAVWMMLLMLYFCVITGILEIPAYRYRIVVEPLVLLVCSTAAVMLLGCCVKKKPPTRSD